MKINGKAKLMALGLTGLLAVGIALPVFAQGPGNGDGSTARQLDGAHRHRAAKGIVRTAAEAIGIEARDLLAGIKSGQTIGEVATANDVEPQAVVDALVANFNEHVDAAVEKGKIDEAKAAELKSKAPERFSKLVNEGHPKRG